MNHWSAFSERGDTLILKRSIFLLFISQLASANELTPTESYFRCYGQLTSTQPAADDPILAQVKTNTLDPITGCKTWLEEAMWNPNETGPDTGSENAAIYLSIVSTLNNLHKSFFLQKTFHQQVSIIYTGQYQIYMILMCLNIETMTISCISHLE